MTVNCCPTCGRPDFLNWAFVAGLLDDAADLAREQVLDEASRNGQVLITNRIRAVYDALAQKEESR